MSAPNERLLKHRLVEAVPTSTAVRGGGSLGVDIVWCIPRLPPILIEEKTTGEVNFRPSNTPMLKLQWDEYKRLAADGHEIRYAVWYKRDDWAIYDVADYLDIPGYPVLKRDAGVSFTVFIEQELRGRT